MKSHYESEAHKSKATSGVVWLGRFLEQVGSGLQHALESSRRISLVLQELDAGLSGSVLLHHEPTAQQVRETGEAADFGDTQSQITPLQRLKPNSTH